jgi:Ca2+-binding EF-hand superfamily protein
MSSVNSISAFKGSSDAWSGIQNKRGSGQASALSQIFSKIDSNNDGGIDKTELKAGLDKISQKTGLSLGGQTDALLSKLDSNSDASISKEELGQALQSQLQPVPNTMSFAQSRSAGGANAMSPSAGQGGNQKDIFSETDTDGDGFINAAESQVLSDKVKAQTGQDTSAMFTKLDSNGDGKLSQTEFNADKPQGGPPSGAGGGGGGSAGVAGGAGPQGRQGPLGAGGPPPKSQGAASASGATSASNKTYDPLDTNRDGKVSEFERLLAQITSASGTASRKSATASADNSSASKRLLKFPPNTDTASAPATPVASASASGFARNALNELAKQVYQSMASNFAGASAAKQGSGLSFMA